ncbi:hypothetical protein [Amycolatopsis sp. GM8]|uniref:hypothetical protein n=1 Tax=Amycolatopsis sp. GM8 TaxID=2896530 RepID=UPI001F2102DC|nr:hypothetical protein [Amycolatopsis sp. GM8]
MARTILRRRSGDLGDIVTAIQVIDRTGIVAASAPPPAEEPAAEPQPVDRVSMLVSATEAQRPVTRRVRRNLVLTCAAALFLIVGWIGGGMWGGPGGQDQDTTPVVAVGAVPNQEQGAVTPNPPAPVVEPAPVPPAPPVAPPVTSTKQAAASTKKVAPKATTKKTTVADRADTPASTPSSTAQNPIDEVSQEFAQLVGPWSWSYLTVRGGGHQGWDSNGR